MHLFGAWGAVILFIGFCFALYLGIEKLFIDPSGRLIAQRAEFFIALTAIILGNQLFLAGFLGELILRSKRNGSSYLIKEEIS